MGPWHVSLKWSLPDTQCGTDDSKLPKPKSHFAPPWNIQFCVSL